MRADRVSRRVQKECRGSKLYVGFPMRATHTDRHRRGTSFSAAAAKFERLVTFVLIVALLRVFGAQALAAMSGYDMVATVTLGSMSAPRGDDSALFGLPVPSHDGPDDREGSPRRAGTRRLP